MNVGVIFCGWGTKDLLDKSLTPWVNLRAQWMGQFDRCSSIVICGLSVRFAGFEGEDDGTRYILKGYRDLNEIDYLIEGPDNIPETLARGMAAKWLIEQGCDVLVQYDSDEVALEEDLSRALLFIEQNPFVAAFRFSYRNLVFTPNQWLAEPFTPMRAFRVKFNRYTAHSFYDDNNMLYQGSITRDFKRDIDLPTMTIPAELFSPKHHTWLSDTSENRERSKNKVSYQTNRGWNCSFAWDDSKGGLIFNPNLPEPKVIRE